MSTKAKQNLTSHPGFLVRNRSSIIVGKLKKDDQAVLDLEANFLNTLIKSQGDMTAFVNRPLAAVLATVTILIWLFPLLRRVLRLRRRSEARS